MEETEWISRQAATEWLRQEYGLSVGAAEATLGRAISSGNVGLDTIFPGVRGPLGKRQRISAAGLGLFPISLLYQDLRLSWADLCSQIEHQLGRPQQRVDAQSRRGRHPSPFWPNVHKRIDEWLEEHGRPTPGDVQYTEFMKMVREWADELAETPPAKSTIQAHAKSRLQLYKAKIGVG